MNWFVPTVSGSWCHVVCRIQPRWWRTTMCAIWRSRRSPSSHRSIFRSRLFPHMYSTLRYYSLCVSHLELGLWICSFGYRYLRFRYRYRYLYQVFRIRYLCRFLIFKNSGSGSYSHLLNDVNPLKSFVKMKGLGGSIRGCGGLIIKGLWWLNKGLWWPN